MIPCLSWVHKVLQNTLTHRSFITFFGTKIIINSIQFIFWLELIDEESCIESLSASHYLTHLPLPAEPHLVNYFHLLYSRSGSGQVFPQNSLQLQCNPPLQLWGLERNDETLFRCPKTIRPPIRVWLQCCCHSGTPLLAFQLLVSPCLRHWFYSFLWRFQPGQE